MGDPIDADLLVTESVAPEHEQEVADAFRQLGVAVHTRVVPPQRIEAEISWLVLVTLPLQAFLASLVGRLAEDAYDRLKGLVARVLQSKPGAARPGQVLVLQDVTSRVQVVLEPDLPAAAYRQLLELDLSLIQQGPLHYDRHQGRWRSELDEWARREPPSQNS